MDPVQTSNRQAVLDRSPAEAERGELTARDDPVLSARELGKRALDDRSLGSWSILYTTDMHKIDRFFHTGDGDIPKRTRGPQA